MAKERVNEMSTKNSAVKISVLMSVYNAEKTLCAAIDSILNQTFTDFEFIICDDASTDNSWEIILQYAQQDKRIMAFQNESNLGLGASLNKCLALSHGDYIARQDADDISVRERLEKTMAYLLEHDYPYVGAGVFIFDEQGVWSKRLFPEHITKHIIAQKNPFFHPTMLFKKDVMLLAGGYRVAEETRRTEDYDLVMRLAAQDIIGNNLQEYLYYVYEPAEAYLRHTRRTRWYEIKVRYHGLKMMKSPLYDYIFLLKPLIMCGIPRKLLKRVKQLQWKNRKAG